tara:strand:+ start:5021 stop:6721 length:1701 start_codon:yes stop_codon:yes gene_type:complete
MSYNFLLFFSYYFIIIFSALGYGLIFSKLINKKIHYDNLGYIGLLGIYILIFYSYLSNLFLAHSQIHNSIVLVIGLFFFIFFIRGKLKKFKKEIIYSSLVFLCLFISIILFKNHDDFPYYHFPYTYYLTQHSFYFGVGEFNHGFRTPSSIFYINSLFYLPYIEYYLFNISQVLVLGFVNIILIKKIGCLFISKIKNQKINYINYLSLLSFIFINIFFYRIAEHGTDRSAQILIFLLIIEIFYLKDLKKIKSENLFYIYLLIAIIISLKAFYVLYITLFVPLLILVYYQKKKLLESFNFLIFNKFFVIFSASFVLVLFSYFANTGCLIYPVSFTCFTNLSWSISDLEVQMMNNWYELWSKAGATPNFRVENPDEYIKNFNWVANWIDKYFFNKVLDFILGLIFLILIVIIFFKKNFFSKKILPINNYAFLIYIIIFLLGLEWFFNHPALRYGGYSLIALIFFIPISLKLQTKKEDIKKYTSYSFILIFITASIFIGRNINRIVKEVEIYNYEPFQKVFYSVDSNNFRIEQKMTKLLSDYNNCIISKSNCSEIELKIKKINGKIVFIK